MLECVMHGRLRGLFPLFLQHVQANSHFHAPDDRPADPRAPFCYSGTWSPMNDTCAGWGVPERHIAPAGNCSNWTAFQRQTYLASDPTCFPILCKTELRYPTPSLESLALTVHSFGLTRMILTSYQSYKDQKAVLPPNIFKMWSANALKANYLRAIIAERRDHALVCAETTGGFPTAESLADFTARWNETKSLGKFITLGDIPLSVVACRNQVIPSVSVE